MVNDHLWLSLYKWTWSFLFLYSFVVGNLTAVTEKCDFSRDFEQRAFKPNLSLYKSALSLPQLVLTVGPSFLLSPTFELWCGFDCCLGCGLSKVDGFLNLWLRNGSERGSGTGALILFACRACSWCSQTDQTFRSNIVKAAESLCEKVEQCGLY